MMTSLMDLRSRREVDISDLRAQNKALQSELVQCQADKDFVWSLWKRLQVSNPDVTEAISLVIQRETEKAEGKDLKVLEILQIKDDRIEELQNIVSKQTQEVGNLLSKKVDLQDQCGRLQLEVDSTRDKLSTSQIQIQQLENREKTVTDMQRKTFESSERDKYGFQRRLAEMSTHLEVVTAEKEESISSKLDLENKIWSLERDMSGKVSKFEDLVKDFEDGKARIGLLESELQQQQREINYKSRELETVRNELSELWTSHNQLTDHSSQQAQLIRQLQSLQQDAQRIMQNQEDAFSMEAISIQQMYTDLSTRYETLKKTETDLRHKIVALKKEVLEKDDTISQLQGPTLDNYNKHAQLGGSFLDFQHEADPVVDYEFKVNSLQEQVKTLWKKLQDKEKIISNFERIDERIDEPSLIFDVNRLNSHERTHSTPTREMLSPKLSPRLTPRGARSITKDGQVVALRRNLADNEHLLELKSKELTELHKAHAKRLERLKSLQHNYRLVKEQLKTLEDEQFGTKTKKKPRRSDPRDLQKENADAVWNELAFFKNENRNMMMEKMEMQEELDMLRVQITHDSATAYELNVKLEQEREEFAYQLRSKVVDNKVKTDIESEVTILKSSVQSKDISLNKLEHTLRSVAGEKEMLFEERRKLKTENLHLQQEMAQYRIQIADLTRDIQRYKRDLDDVNRNTECTNSSTSCNMSESGTDVRRSRSGLHQSGSKIQKRNRSRIARRRKKINYQTALNRSIEKMSSMFEHFNEDGWEEITDTPETEEDTELTESDTLGLTIVSFSRLNKEHSSMTNLTRSSNHKKSNVKVSKQGSVRRRWVQRSGAVKPEKSSSSDTVSSNTTVQCRKIFKDTATSPISFIFPHKEKEKKVTVTPARQLGPLKKRVSYLEQQLITLRSSRANALKSLSEQKESNQQLKTDLNLANQRIRLAKVTIQKLSSDVEKSQKEKSDLEQRIASHDDLSSNASTMQEKHNDQEWKVLEARLKVSTCEVCRQSATIRNLKTENDSLQDQLRSLHDRLNHMERDNNQKRTLVENQRVKLKQVQESMKSDANIISDLETKVKLLTDSNDKFKVQIDSLKKRMTIVSKEKTEYDECYQKISTDLEKKSKQLSEYRTKCSDLEATMTELEQTAKQHLLVLVNRSETAIEGVQVKLTTFQNRIKQYEQFVKMLGNELLRNVQNTRDLLKQTLAKKQREVTPVDSSLQKAQSVAKNILNLSQSDIDDIMSADGDDDEEMDSATEMEWKNDRKWARKCDKLLNTKEFVPSLVMHFLQKIDEREQLAAAVIIG